MRKTQLGRFFDKVISAFDVGLPKEDIEFWHRLKRLIHFEKDRTLFVDDSEDILKTAKDYGIKYILHKKRANSKEVDPDQKAVSGFASIEDFRELL